MRATKMITHDSLTELFVCFSHNSSEDYQIGGKIIRLLKRQFKYQKDLRSMSMRQRRF